MKYFEFSPESDPIDLKVEVVASEIVRNGIQEEDISFTTKGGFKRQFEKDVQGVRFEEPSGNTPGKAHISINREGLYDMLPEGLFHFDDEKIKERARKESATISKIKKQQEAEARKFFKPVENEFYHLLTSLQLKESENLSYFTPEVNRNLFYQIYGYLPDFNDNQVAKLLYFLPLAHKLRGNFEMMEYILQNLLNKKITLKLSKQYQKQEFNQLKSLKDTRLGIDTLLGNTVEVMCNTIIIDVHGLKKEEVTSYFSKGLNNSIIEKVMSFFLPANYFYKVNHFFDEVNKFTYTSVEGESKSYMGYNSWI